MEKIIKLKNKLKKFSLDGYLIPKNDEFFNEYVPIHKDDLQYITGFTGSYGLALILQHDNFLFVDGRYTVQAINQCGTVFKIITLPLIKKDKILKIKGKKIGYDPKLFNENFIKNFKEKLNVDFFPVKDNLVKLIKKQKKITKKDFFYTLDNSITGKSNLKKIESLKKIFNKNNIEIMLITSSENIAWLLNIRGYDSNFSPIPNCFLIINKQREVFLFCDLKKISSKFRKKLNFVNFFEVEDLENFIQKISGKNFLIDGSTCSIFYKNIISKNNFIVKDVDPINILKSQKNNIEIKNTKKIHEYDGAALTKFLFWIQENFEKRKITEITAQNKLLKFKKQMKQFRFQSFPTISSTGSNGAIVHYNASKKTDKVLKKGNIYLVDCGGQYHFGTTDVTRTISLNTKNNKIKDIFTRVLQGHLNLTNYKITKNTTGSVLDKIARKQLKKKKIRLCSWNRSWRWIFFKCS